MKKLLTSIALSAVLLSGCTFLENREGIIKVNDTVITQGEFDNALDKSINNSFLKSFGGSKNFLKSIENPMYPIFKEKIVNELIVKALIEEEVSKKKIEATKEDVDNEIKKIIDKVGSKEELNNILKQRDISNDQFVNDLKTQIKMRKLVNSLEKINISDNEAKKYYNNNKKLFTHGEQVRASHILVSANTLDLIQQFKAKNSKITPEELNNKIDEEFAKQKAKADEILKQVKSDPDSFARVAQKQSDDKASAERGGELGYFSKEDMVPEFSKVAFSMKPNTISENLVKSPYGYHIILVTDRIEAGTTSFDTVKDEIKFYLETQKQIEVLKKLTDSLLKNAKVDYLNTSYDPKTIAEEAQKSAEYQKELQEKRLKEKEATK